MCSEYIKRVPNIFGVPSLFSIIHINKLKWIKKFKNPISVSKKTHLVKVRENTIIKSIIYIYTYTYFAENILRYSNNNFS